MKRYVSSFKYIHHVKVEGSGGGDKAAIGIIRWCHKNLHIHPKL